MPAHKRNPDDQPHKPTSRRLSTIRRKLYRRELWLILLAAVLLMIGVLTMPKHPESDSAFVSSIADSDATILLSKDIHNKLSTAQNQIKQLEDTQAKAGVQAIPDTTVQSEIAVINLDIKEQNLRKARTDLNNLLGQIPDWQKQVTDAVNKQHTETKQPAQLPAAPSSPPPGTYWQVPILMYHKTPADFDAQLRNLIAKGYHVISMDQLYAAMTAHQSLPSKPVVITFDDGYADQMTAYNLLKKYNMPATFYIIDGGAASNWCIGAGRQYNLPSQPAKGCGDQYLTWNQVRELDQSGLITIGAHTIDHLNLPSVSLEEERRQIIDGKAQLEAKLGHTVHYFAYPYGSFNAATISIVQAAGFADAVSTIPGEYQTKASLFSLHRDRSAYNLP